MNYPCPLPSSGCYAIAGRAHIHCPFIKAGLQSHVCQDLYLGAHLAPLVPLVMGGTMFRLPAF